MSGKDFDLGAYKTVAQRMADFYEKHPNGSLRPLNPAEPFTIHTIGAQTFLAYTAVAYREPDDVAPGVGMAWEPFPGKTPYTRDSELQNAETSAWGRAILAAGASDTQSGVASRDEVAARSAKPTRPPREAEKWMRRLADAHNVKTPDLEQIVLLTTDGRSDDILDVAEGDEWNELKGRIKRFDQPEADDADNTEPF